MEVDRILASQINTQPLYTSWSFIHILTFIFPFILTFILIFFTRKMKKENTYKLGLVLSIVAIAILIARNIEVLITTDFAWPNADIIPLQLCHVANFILLAAYITKKKVIFGIAYTIFMPAAALSLVFTQIPSLPDYYSSWISARTIAYIFGHALIVSLALFSVYHKHAEINLKSIIQISLFTLVFYLFELVISNVFNIFMEPNADPNLKANYFYVLHPNGIFPLTAFYNFMDPITLGGWFEINILYNLFSILLGTVVIIMFSGIYYLGEYISKTIERKKQIKDIPETEETV